MLCVINSLQEVSAVQNSLQSRMPIDRCVKSVGMQSIEVVMNMCEHIEFALGDLNTKVPINLIITI